MDSIPQLVTLVSVGLIFLVLFLGFLSGLRRGWKRALMHLLFGVAAMLTAVFLTRGTTSKILSMTFTINGEDVILSDYILSLLNIDLSSFGSANDFVTQLPAAIVNPILFVVFGLLAYFVFNIIYLIVARIFFGTKNEDFKVKNHKPRRLIGSAIGMIEGAVLLIVLVSPVISLTNTYEEVVHYASVANAVSAAEEETGSSSNRLSTISDLISTYVPSEVDEAIVALNDSLLGKISSTTGVGDLIFDVLSNIKIDGEKINLRTELVAVCNTYDEFVGFYNNIVDSDFENLDFADLKSTLTEVVDNNLFKVVISNTLNDFIINYDLLNEQYDLDAKLGDFSYIIKDLKEKAADENFSMYDYLRSDLMTILDIMDDAVKSHVVQQIKETSTYDIETVLNLLEKNSEFVQRSLNSVFGLNIVKDSMSSLARIMSDKLASYEIEGVELNPNMTDDDVNTLSSLLSDVVDLLADLDISGVVSIVKADNKLTAIAELDNMSDTLILMGQILDKLNAMPLLNYESGGTQVNALTNLLSNYDLSLLGDEVYYTEDADEKTTLSTYEMFFTYISSPLTKIKDAGLLDVIAGGSFDFNSIKSALIDAICGTGDNPQTDPTFIADILMPFYYLDTNAKFGDQTLKELVFNTVVTTLDSNLKSFATIQLEMDANDTTDYYKTYQTNLTSLGDLIVILNGEYSEEQTYLDYLITDTPDYLALANKMNSGDVVKDRDLYKMLEIVFVNSMYSPLQETLFITINETVKEITTVSPAIDYSDLSIYAGEYAESISELLTAIKAYDSDSEALITDQLDVVGGLLDTLKEGNLDEVFDNFIWYLTGDYDTDDIKYQNEDPNDYATYVKNYLTSETDYNKEGNGYRDLTYSKVMSKAQSVIKLANQMTTNLKSVTIESENGITDFVNALNNAVTSLYDLTTEENISTACDIIETAKRLDIDYETALNLSTTDDFTSYLSTISSKIDELTGTGDGKINSNIAASLKALLGITTTSGDSGD